MASPLKYAIHLRAKQYSRVAKSGVFAIYDLSSRPGDCGRSVAETMILRPGITSVFGSGGRGSLPEYWIGDFKCVVHAVTAAQEWAVGSIAEAGITPNFHIAELKSPTRFVFILGHSSYPIVAFTEKVSDIDQHLYFIDVPEIMSIISRSFPSIQIANAIDLNRSITDDDLAQLAPADRKQVEYWKPRTIGQIAFNWWD
jgi:hypothetical protein